MKLADTCACGEKYGKPRQHIKKQRHYFTNKGPSSQSYGFSSSPVWMWELDHKESWVPKNWCFWTVVLEETLESPLDCKEIKPVYPKKHQSQIFIGKTDAEAETPVLWPPDVKSWLIRKDPDAGKNLKAKEEGDVREQNGWMASPTQWTWVWASSGRGKGQGSLACCSHGVTKSQTWLSDGTELNEYYYVVFTTGHWGRQHFPIGIWVEGF